MGRKSGIRGNKSWSKIRKDNLPATEALEIDAGNYNCLECVAVSYVCLQNFLIFDLERTMLCEDYFRTAF